MDTNLQKCQSLAKDIKNIIKKSGFKFNEFIYKFIREKDKDIGFDAYKKMFSRINNKENELDLENTIFRLQEIYEFLLRTKECRNLCIYKPLMDDKFEREALGDELYEKIKDNSSKFKV